MENHSVIIENRQLIRFTAVAGIGAFDEEEVCVQLKEGGMTVRGKGMKIQKLDLQAGEAVICGEIISAAYTKKAAGKKLFAKCSK